MYAESTKFGRPSLLLPLDSFHDAEGLPIPSPFDSHPKQPKIVTSHGGRDEPRASAFPSPDIDQKISQRLLDEEDEADDMIDPGCDFSPVGLDDGEDFGMSPAAMFLSSFSPRVAEPPRLPDAEGETVAGYTLGPIIGYGGSSIIRCASSSSGGTVAVKIVRRADIERVLQPSLARKRLDHEASIWSSLSHEHILPLFSVVNTPHADFFVTLYCPAGSLLDILKRDGRPALPQDDAGMMFRQVVRGLRYLHELAQLVHRDIKLENVLVDEMGVCRIGDFGMSRNIGDLDGDDDEEQQQQQQQEPERHRTQSQSGAGLERRATFAQTKRSKEGPSSQASLMRHQSAPRHHRNSTPAGESPAPAPLSHAFQPGSLPYAAPELLTPTPVRVAASQDIWALGVMLYAMLTGRLPFTDSYEPRLQMKILHGTLMVSKIKYQRSRLILLSIGVYEIPAGIGRGAELVLKGCIDKCASTRWTISMVDELAWGVGWGDAEGSGVCTPSHEEVEIMTQAHRSASQSRTRSRSRATRLESNHASGSAPYSLDAARTRSKSRRSPSRASRSASRHSPLAESVISTDSYYSFDRHYESALLTSPAPSRGRLSDKSCVRSASRSTSPSAVPPTPTDLVRGYPLPPLDDVIEGEPSRGRKAFARESTTPRPRVDSDAASDTEATRWSSPDAQRNSLLSGLPRRFNPLFQYHPIESSRASSSTSLWAQRTAMVNVGSAMRAGSTPPLKEDGNSPRQGRGFLCESASSTPGLLGTPVSNIVRSRSAGG